MLASPDLSTTSRQDVEFSSQGTRCRAWLTYPASAAHGLVPLVVMGHGFGATREMRLEQYAQRFNAAGFASLIFDYRRFGASEGEPRQLLVPRDELEDWRSAFAFARSLPGVDRARIALWGTSFAGGLVVSAAAAEGDVAAIVSQCPLMDGRAAALTFARYAGLPMLLRMAVHGALDLVRAAVSGSAQYVPIVGHPGELGAMSSADAWDGCMRLVSSSFDNRVAARITLLLPQFRPVEQAAQVRCPALLQLCEKDCVAPVSAAERAAARMPRAEVVRYPVGHFDVYVGADFERSVSDQLAFLRKHLSASPTADPARAQQRC